MRKFLGAFLSLLLVAPPIQASYCFRTPLQPFRHAKDLSTNCKPIVELSKELIDPSIDRALDRVTAKLDQNPKQESKIWKRFLEQLRTKPWSKRHFEIAQEIHQKLGLEALEFESPSETKGDLSGPADFKVTGWEDIVVIKNGQPFQIQENRSLREQLQKQEKAHWMVYSSAYQPVIVWESGSKLVQSIESESNLPWISKLCSTETQYNWQDIQIQARVIPSLACPHQQTDFFRVEAKADPFLGLSSIKKIEPVLLGALGIAALGFIAYSLKDKKLVIRK